MTHYRRDIDGLRALAILAVVIYHAVPNWLPGGFSGVDVFFVISGYLITGILLKELSSRHMPGSPATGANGGRSRDKHGMTAWLLHFYQRRILRIFPALITVVATCLIVGWFILLPAEYEQLGKHTLGAGVFASNFMLWKESGYFDGASDTKPLLHLWSLAVEEQFYLLWPLLMWAAWKWGRHVLLLIIVLAVASLATSLLATPHWPEASFFLAPARFWELMAGGLLARTEHRLRLPAGLHTPLGFAGLFAILLGYVLFSPHELYPYWRALLPVGGAVALIAAGPQSWVNRHLLGNGPAVAIGLISYPLYLWHWPLLSGLAITESGTAPAWLRLAAVGVAVLLAILTTRYIERPIRYGTTFRLGWLVAIMLALSGVGAAIQLHHGLPQWRGLNTPAFHDLERLDAYRTTLTRCRYKHTRDLDWCYQSKPTPPTMALFGDSHADALFPGIHATDARSWLLIGQSSCPPLMGVELLHDGKAMGCQNRNRRALNAVLADPAIGTVVLTNIGSVYLGHSLSPQHTGKHAPSRYQLDDGSGEEKAAIYARGLEATVRTLEKAGKRVVLVLDMPQFSIEPVRCLARPFTLIAPAMPEPCAQPRAPMRAMQQPYRALVARLQTQHPQLRVYDPYPALCTGARCHLGQNGRLNYRDTHHLSIAGATRVAEDFTKWLEAKAPAP